MHAASFGYKNVTTAVSVRDKAARPGSRLPGALPLHTCWPFASFDATSAGEYARTISLDGATERASYVHMG